MKRVFLAGSALVLMMAAGLPRTAQAEADLGCKMKFSLTGWSLIYKRAEGSGVVTCADGTSIPVKISAHGGGLTVGKSHIDNGNGEFSDVHTITDVLGDYAQASAHAGMVKSAGAGVLTKGNVSLALAGKGEGVDLGIDVTKLTIKEAGRLRHR